VAQLGGELLHEGFQIRRRQATERLLSRKRILPRAASPDLHQGASLLHQVLASLLHQVLDRRGARLRSRLCDTSSRLGF